MASFTPNLNLNKPDILDEFDLDVINSNWDKIDQAYNNAYIDHFETVAADTNVQASTVVLSRSVAANTTYLVEVDLHVSTASVGGVLSGKFNLTNGAALDLGTSRGNWLNFPAAAFTPSSLAIAFMSTDTNTWLVKGIFVIGITTAGTISLAMQGTTLFSIKAGSVASFRAAL